MTESWIIEIGGDTAGIVVREPGQRWFAFHAAKQRFSRFNGQTFPGPREAERWLREQIARRVRKGTTLAPA